MFPSGLANLKRNPGVGSIPLKSIVIFKLAQRVVELSTVQVLEADLNQLLSIALSEAICIRSKGHRPMFHKRGGNGPQ